MGDQPSSDQDLFTLASSLGERLIDLKKTICCVESCTGGWISKVLTDIDGSSQWFGYGWVTYSNLAKGELVGVAQETLKEHGAVSQAVVKQMVVGALDKCSADLALSVSGIAGPGGGSELKPVGTVCFGLAVRGSHSQLDTKTETLHFSGDREQVRRQTVAHSLNLALQALET